MAKSRSATPLARVHRSDQVISGEARKRMIAEAAYYRALNRHFKDGDPLDDWLAAEREINQRLPNARQQKEEAVVYEKLREAVSKFLGDAHDGINGDTVRHAFDKATEEIKKTGTHAAETVTKIAATLRKDMAATAAKMGPKWEAFSEKSADMFSVWRDRGNVFLGQAADAVGEWLQQTGAKLAPAPYHAGEMVARGTFECALCGERVTLSTGGHLPACPQCGKREYRRV
ncbi:MAG TPA: DUF2934 domain-containing protein [Burkholderiales bacterium]